jgi:uncharacterized RDD family membrane protein YckC
MTTTKTIREERWILAPLGTRTLAFIIDFAIFLALMFLLGLLAKPIGNALWDLEGMLAQITQWQKDYGLLIFQEGSWVMATSVEAAMQNAYTAIATDTVTAYLGYQNYLEILKGMIAIAAVFLVPTLILKDGKTIGKKIMKLRLITLNGDSVRPVIMMFRTMIGMWAIEYVTSVMFSYIGVLLSILFTILTKRQSAIHDIIGRTMVVRDEKQIIDVEIPITIESPQPSNEDVQDEPK